MIEKKIKQLNNFRKKINSKKLSIGSWLHLDCTNSAEIMSQNSNFDWLVVDKEHGQFNNSSLADLCRAIEVNNTLPFVRISSNRRDEIQRDIKMLSKKERQPKEPRLRRYN